jgi:flagellar hook-associated protein 1 FlgK
MSKISAMMDIGKRSLANSQTKIQTVAHNIANKSTEGYSRQRVDQVSNEPIGTGRLRMGMGAKAAQVSRITNPYLEKQIATEGSKLGFLQQKDEVMGQVEQVFNEQQNKGLNHYISEFFNSFRALAANPESVANRTLIRENAIALTNDFRRVRSQLTDIQRDVDQRLSEQVSEINDYSKEVAKLNEKIQMVEMQGVPANDERDRRDLLIKKISEKVNIKASEGRDGQVAITAGNSALLVSGYSHMDLGVSARPEEGIRREGNFDIVHHPSPDSEEFVVTNQISGGAMGGLLHIRDVVVNDLLDPWLRKSIKLTFKAMIDTVERVFNFSVIWRKSEMLRSS